MDWHSVHVYYYADDRDALILHGVRPLFDRLRRDVESVESAFFLRHWRQGPHLRLNLRCPESALERSVRPVVNETVGRFLRERPSTQVMDPEQHLPMHRRLAELEFEPGPLLPWYPDNSIRYTSFDRRPHVLGDGDGGLLLDFYADTNDLVFQMIDGIAQGRRRHSVAFDLMISTAHALSAIGIVRGAVSFRSHAEAFLSGYPEGRGLRRRWDGHYAANEAALTERVRTVVAVLDGDGGAGVEVDAGAEAEVDGEVDGDGDSVPYVSVPHVRDWVAALIPYRRRVKDLIAAGRFALPSPLGADAVASVTSDLGRASSFHRELLATSAWARMQEADWFVSYRLMLNFTYLQLTRLGITPAERFLLCHLAANAVEGCYGVSALDLVRGGRADVPVDLGGRPS